MLKKMLLGILAVAGLSFAQSYDGWSYGRVTSIRIQGMRVLVQQELQENPAPCSSDAYMVLTLSDTDPYTKAMYAALLQAYANGNDAVEIALSGCDNGWAIIQQVWVR